MSRLLRRTSSHKARISSSSLRLSVRFGRQEQVLGQLLRQRRAALDEAADPQVGKCGARQPDGVDAPMLVEAAVLGGDHRVEQMLRDRVDRRVGLASAALGEHGTVAGQDAHDGRALFLAQRLRVGNGGRVVDERAGDADERRDAQIDRRQDGQADFPGQTPEQPPQEALGRAGGRVGASPASCRGGGRKNPNLAPTPVRTTQRARAAPPARLWANASGWGLRAG